MKIAYIGTYPPRQCGIGTFTHNKFNAIAGLKSGEQHEGFVVALNCNKKDYTYPDEVKFEIQHDRQNDYLAAADFINTSGAHVCIVEHEFGIFGGENGIYLLPLLHRLKIPVIAVFHTVLKTPGHHQQAIISSISRIAAKVVVMTQKAVEFLTTIYGVSQGKITVIEHGVPDYEFDRETLKEQFGLNGKTVLLTFGLIGRNKGIETVIKALPDVVKKYPDLVYIVLGKTHPAVVRHAGEEYRDYLENLCRDLNVADHVVFVNEFVDEEKLCQYLGAADIYVTPYLNEAQITSGTLSYAVGAGCAVLSTPYWHAAELLPRVGGKLFDFNNDGQLSLLFQELLSDPGKLRQMQQQARLHGREMTWPRAGAKYIAVSRQILAKANRRVPAKVQPALSFSSLALDHVRRMTDNTGIIQHAKYGIPNFKEGYCLDDNARALLMALMAYRQQKHVSSVELMRVYLAYIHYMQNDDGSFRNFLSFNRNFLDDRGSEDSFGRTIWALGYLLSYPPNDTYYLLGKEIFFNAAPHFATLNSIRAVANTLVGVCLYLQSDPYHEVMRTIARTLGDRLLRQYKEYSSGEWQWFEHSLTYDNALLPLAMFHAAEILDDARYLHCAKEATAFLTRLTMKSGYLSIIGNERWCEKDGEQSLFAQQPVDAMMSVLLYQKAYGITNDKMYFDHMYASFMWFHGENDLRMALYDPESKGCYDGLECYGVNRNQGAESTLAYLVSHLAMLETTEEMEISHMYDQQLSNSNGNGHFSVNVAG